LRCSPSETPEDTGYQHPVLQAVVPHEVLTG
jgi:hypothetical protein